MLLILLDRDQTNWPQQTRVHQRRRRLHISISKDIDAPNDWFGASRKIVLDLGMVKEIAEVSVNGKPVGGILWKPPFQADVASAMRPGKNHVEIKITSLWPNRLIGDAQPGATKHYTSSRACPNKRSPFPGRVR